MSPLYPDCIASVYVQLFVRVIINPLVYLRMKTQVLVSTVSDQYFRYQLRSYPYLMRRNRRP